MNLSFKSFLAFTTVRKDFPLGVHQRFSLMYLGRIFSGRRRKVVPQNQWIERSKRCRILLSKMRLHSFWETCLDETWKLTRQKVPLALESCFKKTRPNHHELGVAARCAFLVISSSDVWWENVCFSFHHWWETPGFTPIICQGYITATLEYP